MAPNEYIKQRQILWALRHQKRLGGQFRHDPDPAQTARGEKSFVYDLKDNLFLDLAEDSDTRREFEAGKGKELIRKTKKGRMYAVNSSSAMSVNVFHYWRQNQQVDVIAGACRLPSRDITSLEFEAKHPIFKTEGTGSEQDRPTPPHLDVLIRYADRSRIRASAIECKFQEPYSRRTAKGLKPVYLEHPELWDEMPNLREIAERVSPENTRFAYLNAPQLIKHLLGLKRSYGKQGFRLLYLWYDAPGHEAVKHAREVEEFISYPEKDGILVQSITYQQVILSLARHQRESHTDYVDYVVERYL